MSMPLVATLAQSPLLAFAVEQQDSAAMLGSHARRLVAIWFAIGLAQLPMAAANPTPLGSSKAEYEKSVQESLEGLRAADMRLASIVYHLARDNRALCDRQTRVTGLVLHRLVGYRREVRDTARSYFGFATAVAVEGVISGSPAQDAGLRAGDSLVAIGGIDIDHNSGIGASGSEEDESTAWLEARIAALSAGAPVAIDVIRNGLAMRVQLGSLEGCAGRAEVRVSTSLNAASGEDTIQFNTALMNLLTSDVDLASVVAHELSHIIMRHSARLTVARVDRGLLREFGRNAQLIMQTEIEADRLSVHLLANSNYDPASASHYLRLYRKQLHTESILAGKTHLNGRDRIALLDREAVEIISMGVKPSIPDWLDNRARPLR